MKRTRIDPWRLSWRASALLLLAAPCARAQTTVEAEATWRSLVAQAQSARAAGDHGPALELAQRALAIHATPSLHHFVAQEQSTLGQYAAALASAQRCVDGATANRNLPERAATLASCATLTTTLEQRVAHVQIVPPEPSPAGLRVTVSETEVPAALLGVPYVINPGAASIDADADGRQHFHRALSVVAGESRIVQLTLPEVVHEAPPPTPPLEPASPPPVVVTAPPVAVRPRPSPAPTPTSTAPWQTPLAWTTTIGAGVGLVAGFVALGIRQATASTFNNNCFVYRGIAMGGGDCVSEQGTVSTAQDVEIGAFVTAGVLAVASGVFWLTAPSSHRTESPAATLRCGGGPGRFGVACRLEF